MGGKRKYVKTIWNTVTHEWESELLTLNYKEKPTEEMMGTDVGMIWDARRTVDVLS